MAQAREVHLPLPRFLLAWQPLWRVDSGLPATLRPNKLADSCCPASTGRLEFRWHARNCIATCFQRPYDSVSNVAQRPCAIAPSPSREGNVMRGKFSPWQRSILVLSSLAISAAVAGLGGALAPVHSVG